MAVHLEEEGDLAAHVPDAVGGLQRLSLAGRDQRQVDALLGLGEEVGQRRTLEEAALLAARDPASESQPVAVLDEHAHQRAVFVVPRLERVLRPQCL
jgi:hypothetical protein